MVAYGFNETLMFWGGVTLVVAFISYFIFRKQKKIKDQSGLICKSVFSFAHSPNEIKPNHKLKVKSVSDELITVAFIRYYIKPRGFLRRLFMEATWKAKRWIYDDKLNYILDLEEGDQEDLEINLPVWVSITDVLRVKIFDHAGKGHQVNWPSPSNLAIQLHSEKLYETEERNENRMCKIIGYKASGKYRIYVCWNLRVNQKGILEAKLFHFKEKNKYTQKLKDIVENQRPKLLVDAADEIK